jgi:hypothetical protein
VSFGNPGFGRAAEIVGRASLPVLAITLVALLVTNFFVLLRWHLILSAEVPSPGARTLLKIVFVGLFFNQSAAYRCRRRRRSRLALPQARHRGILLDRACGYLVLIVVYAASLPSLLSASSAASKARKRLRAG